jgi:hypothetical protein
MVKTFWARNCAAAILMLCTTICGGCGTLSSSPKAVRIYEPSWKDSTCSLHHEELIEAIEPLFHGKCDYASDYYSARKHDFPWANTNMQGEEEYWRARYCRSCREAQARFDSQKL